MTQSDDTSERDASNREAKLFEDRPVGEQSGSRLANKNEIKTPVHLGDDPSSTAKNPEIVPPSSETKMGSTDSGNTHSGGGSSCGLVSSLFPNSCRGRAESFARRLHRRLTSLGGEANSSDEDVRSQSNKPTESSWLHVTATSQSSATTGSTINTLSATGTPEERVYERQPRHSPETDVFYDFDPSHDDTITIDGTISPVEMANPSELAKILVNPRIPKTNHHEACHCSPGPRPPDFIQDSQTEYVFSSPIGGLSPDTDNSDAYFDPESSETEKSRGNDNFYDPQTTSESEVAATGITNGDLSTRICKFTSRRRAERGERNGENWEKPFNEDSESSNSSSCNLITLEGVARPKGIAALCSSEESINGKSSRETTSPSHESLWSTFDESTMSLQDESPLAIACNNSVTPTTIAKSHSDSEIIGTSGVVTENRDDVDFTKNPKAEEKNVTNGDNNGENLSNLSRLVLDESLADCSCVATENDHSTYSSSIDIPGALLLEYPSGKRLSNLEERVKNEVLLRIGESVRDEDVDKMAERLARTPSGDATNEEETKSDGNSAESEAQTGNDEKDDENTTKEQEDEEEDDEDDGSRPQRVRRCSSLKTGKTPPGTPGRKKIVRFADVLGLDLADVRTFLDEIPKVPNSAYSDLIYDEAFQKDSSPVNFWGTGPATFTTPLFAATMGTKSSSGGAKFDRILVPLFQQPGGQANFLDLVRERQVCLENVLVQDPVAMCLQGTVRVRNLDFHKSVHVRYTLDSWRNFSDLQATYAVNSCDGFSDKFTFVLYCHTLKIGQRLELAVRFQCKGIQYWDNNSGANYCFQCLPATTTSPGNYIPITVPANTGNSNARDWSPTFY